MITIPNKNRQFIQSDGSDILGNLYSTFNNDYASNVGTLRLSKRFLLNVSTSDIAELTNYAVGFRYFNNGTTVNIYTVAGLSGTGYVFQSGAPNASFTKVATVGAPTTLDSVTSDIETAFGYLYVTSASNHLIYYQDGSGTWANFSAGAAGSTMMLCYYPSLQKMYVTKSGNIIQSFTGTGGDLATALTLSAGENITFLRAGSNRIWIGTVNTTGGKGYVYEWDGSSSQVTKSYRLQSGGALACVIKDDTPYIIDAKGDLLVWNGGTFTRLAGFKKKTSSQFFSALFNTNKRFIHPNGMAVIEGKIHILVDLTNNDAASHNGTQDDCNPSGIWEYEPLTDQSGNLKHKYAPVLSKSGGTITDYGQFRIFGAGGLGQLISTSNLVNGTILAGMSVYTDATTTTAGIFYEDTADTLQKAGYFTSSWILSGEALTQNWNAIWGLHKKFLNATDRMVIKARVYEDTPTEGTITWTATNGFNTTADLSTYAVGDEVEVIQGLGSGKCAHILTIQAASAGSYIVTVDETFTSATGTSKARFAKWKKLGTIQDTKDFDMVTLKSLTASRKIQVKVWMLFTGKNEMDGLMIDPRPYQK